MRYRRKGMSLRVEWIDPVSSRLVAYSFIWYRSWSGRNDTAFTNRSAYVLFKVPHHAMAVLDMFFQFPRGLCSFVAIVLSGVFNDFLRSHHCFL